MSPSVSLKGFVAQLHFKSAIPKTRDVKIDLTVVQALENGASAFLLVHGGRSPKYCSGVAPQARGLQ